LTKGVFGLGLPLIGVPVMVAAIPFQTAIALFAVPTFTSNLQQAIAGKRLMPNLRRFWPLLLVLTVTTPIAVQWLVTASQDTGLLVLGVVSVIFALVQLFPSHLVVHPHQEKWLAPLVGLASGVMSGISGVYGPPLIVYLVALRLPKEEFVAAISLMYFLGSVTLYSTLALHGVLTGPVLIASALGAAVVAGMMVIAGKLRHRIDEARYRKLILGLLIVLGLDMIRRGLT